VIHQAQQEQILRDALSALQPRCARMVQMLFFDTPARPYSEIAKQLGLATGSIGFIRGRCLDQLKKQLLSRGWK
jgi:DNA-directed RNA polymerase specialized sigma24 family protein